MTKKMVSTIAVFLFVLTGFMQGLAQTDKRALHTFTKKDGTKVEGRIQKYSTSTGMVRVKTDAGEEFELPFDEISPENQKILTEWKMDQIVQSSNFKISYKRLRGDTDESFKRGTDIKVKAEPIQHELTLENKERIPITGLTILYAVAYERSSVLGKSVRSSDDDGLGFYFEELPVQDIPAKETVVIETPTFTLESYEDVSDRDGGRGSEGGGKEKADYKGVVFRFLRNGEIIHEEAQPTSLAKRDFSIRPDNAPPKPAE